IRARLTMLADTSMRKVVIRLRTSLWVVLRVASRLQCSVASSAPAHSELRCPSPVGSPPTSVARPIVQRRRQAAGARGFSLSTCEPPDLNADYRAVSRETDPHDRPP